MLWGRVTVTVVLTEVPSWPVTVATVQGGRVRGQLHDFRGEVQKLRGGDGKGRHLVYFVAMRDGHVLAGQQVLE